MKVVIFFDIGNVLIKFSLEKMYEHVAKVTGLYIDQIKDFFINQKYGEKYELGIVSENTIFSELLKRSKQTFKYEDLIKTVSNIFQENEMMFDIISQLKNRGHRLVLLSNTCYAHFNYQLKFFPIIGLFEEKILSFEKNLRKPDPKIFQLALNMANGQKSFYVDDTPEHIQAATNVGLDGEIFQNPNKLLSKLKEKKIIN